MPYVKGAACQADADCPSNMHCTETRGNGSCQCIYNWAETGPYCTEQTPVGGFCLFARCASLLSYVGALLFVVYVLSSYIHDRHQLGRRYLGPLLFFVGSTVLGSVNHSAKLIFQSGVQFGPSGPRTALLLAALGLSGACVLLGFLQLSLIWINICIATSQLKPVDEAVLQRTRRYAIAGAVVFAPTIVLFTLANLTAGIGATAGFLAFAGLTLFAVTLLGTYVIGTRWLRRLLQRASLTSQRLESQVRGIEDTSQRITLFICLFLTGAVINLVGSVCKNAVVNWIGGILLCAARLPVPVPSHQRQLTRSAARPRRYLAANAGTVYACVWIGGRIKSERERRASEAPAALTYVQHIAGSSSVVASDQYSIRTLGSSGRAPLTMNEAL